jgi:hypothetical protein
MDGTGVSKSQVSRLCEEIDARVRAFLDRPLEGDWPYVWLDATYVKVRRNNRIVSVAVIVAAGVNGDARREVLGMDIGSSEAETFWTEFPSKLRRRVGLRKKYVEGDGGRVRVREIVNELGHDLAGPRPLAVSADRLVVDVDGAHEVLNPDSRAQTLIRVK